MPCTSTSESVPISPTVGSDPLAPVGRFDGLDVEADDVAVIGTGRSLSRFPFDEGTGLDGGFPMDDVGVEGVRPALVDEEA